MRPPRRNGCLDRNLSIGSFDATRASKRWGLGVTESLPPYNVLVIALQVSAVLKLSTAAATPSIFSNVEPRRDNAGNIIDAHDGNYIFQNGTWWYFAMGYGLCNDTGTVNGCDPKCGYSPANTVGVWSSTTLSNNNWTKRSEVLAYADRPNGTNCTYFRSHGAFSRSTKKWVVWVNAISCPALNGNTGYLAATADHPAGPWKYVGPVKTKTRDSRLGDMDLFVDDDGTGYAVLTRCCGAAPKTDDRRMVVEKLSPDLLSVGGQDFSMQTGLIVARVDSHRGGVRVCMRRVSRRQRPLVLNGLRHQLSSSEKDCITRSAPAVHALA